MTKPTGRPRGRPRKAAAEKIAEGNRSKVKVVDLLAMRRKYAQQFAPPIPPKLIEEDADTLAIWNRLVENYPHLTQEHEETLKRYCCIDKELEGYVRMLRRTGPLVKGSRGVVRSPAFSAIIDAARTLNGLAIQLGIAPDPEAANREPPDPLSLLLG